jgi:hypothetical protein
LPSSSSSSPSQQSPTSPTSSPSPTSTLVEEEKKNKKKPSIWDWFETTFDDFKDKIENFFGDKDKEKTSQ